MYLSRISQILNSTLFRSIFLSLIDLCVFSFGRERTLAILKYKTNRTERNATYVNIKVNTALARTNDVGSNVRNSRI